MEKILWALNKMPKSDDKCLPVMSLENIKQAREFHKSFPQYTITRLRSWTVWQRDLALAVCL